MGHRQQQHMGRSQGDDRDLAGRDLVGAESLDEAIETAAPPEVAEAQHIQELVDGARGQWTAADRASGRAGRRGRSGR